MDCPKRKALNALLKTEEAKEAASEEEPEEPKMGALRLLNAVKKQPASPKRATKGLMYVDVSINGQQARALVDTGATHNFISEGEAKRLGLKTERDTSRIKAVNSAAKPIHGIAKGVELQIGGWKGTTNLTVAPLDDFKVVLGIEFLEPTKAVPMPYLGTLGIMDEGTPCMIPTVNVKTSVPTLSALLLVKGVKKGEETFVAALVGDEENGSYRL